MKFQGLGTALITPFLAGGEVDYESLGNVIEHQIGGGIDFLCILATTAETPTLSKEEKTQIKNFIIEQVKGRVPLLMGCGGNCTKVVCEELRTSDWSGIDGVLSVVPFYNKPTQEGLYQHFKAISEASPLPVVLYNVPGRVGVNMKAETTLKIAHSCKNIVAIKEASGDIQQIKEIIDGKPEDFDVLSGDDGLTFDILRAGGKGVISVISNGLTELFARLVHQTIKGNFEEAKKIDNNLELLYTLLFADGNPAGIKALMEEEGLIKNVLRLPLVSASEETTRKIKEAYHKVTNNLCGFNF